MEGDLFPKFCNNEHPHSRCLLFYLSVNKSGVSIPELMDTAELHCHTLDSFMGNIIVDLFIGKHFKPDDHTLVTVSRKESFKEKII